MRLLLDTQVLIWVASGRGLPVKAHAAYADPANDLIWSAASHWEIAIKKSVGKLELEFADLDAQIVRHRIEWLPIGKHHCRAYAALPLHHGDPFDRLLIAQALSEDITIIGSDTAFDAYGVRRIW